jgi:hypothetical protein
LIEFIGFIGFNGFIELIELIGLQQGRRWEARGEEAGRLENRQTGKQGR